MALTISGTGTGSSIYSTVIITSQQLTLVADQAFVLSSTTACWVKFGTNPTAVAGAADNTYLPPNTLLRVQLQAGSNKMAVIREAADGKISATFAL